MHQTEDTHLQVGQLTRFVMRRKGILLLATLATFCASLVAVSVMPPGYQSSATIMIRDRETLSRQVEDVMGGVQRVKGYKDEENRAKQIAGRIRSYPFLERVVTTLHMTDDPELLEEARKTQEEHPDESVNDIATRVLVDRISGRISIASLGAGIVRISVTDREPQSAQLLAKWISELFIDVTTSKELEQIRSVRRFGDQQLRIYEQELKTAEDDLEAYQRNMIEDNLVNGIVSKENLLSAESLHSRQVGELGDSQARIDHLGRKAVEMGFSGSFSNILEDSQASKLSADLTSALDRLTLVQMTNGESDAADAEITSARNSLYQGLKERCRELYPGFGPDIQDAVASYAFAWFDVESRKAAAGHLKRHIDDFRRLAKDNPANQMELTKLQERVDEKRRLLESFRAQTVASDVSQAVETTNLGEKIEILDPAQVPLYPSSPNKRKILVLSLIMGPLLGLGLGFLAEVLDPTLRTVSDIQRIAPEAILGVVPLLGRVPTRRNILRRNWIPVTMMAVIVLTATAFALKTTVLSRWDPGPHSISAVAPEGDTAR